MRTYKCPGDWLDVGMEAGCTLAWRLSSRSAMTGSWRRDANYIYAPLSLRTYNLCARKANRAQLVAKIDGRGGCRTLAWRLAGRWHVGFFALEKQAKSFALEKQAEARLVAKMRERRDRLGICMGVGWTLARRLLCTRKFTRVD